MQVDAFILQGSPEALDEDVVDTASFAVHRDPGANSYQATCPGEGRKLTALVRVHDPGYAEEVDGFVQGFDTEFGLKCIRDAPGQHLAGEPVHDGDEIEEAAPHRQVR